jgi:hypothetical protein
LLIGNTFKIYNLLIQNFIQISICGITLALIEKINNNFAWSWQNVTPGLFFISFFFGTQFKILNNIASKHIIKDITI